MSSLANQIREAADLATEQYEVPEWGVTLELRSMSSRQRSAFADIRQSADGEEAEELTAKGVASVMIYAILVCAHDPNTGEPVFDVAEDMDWIVDKSAGVIDRVGTRCLIVSGLTQEAESDAGKDSSGSPTPTDDPDLSEDFTSA